MRIIFPGQKFAPSVLLGLSNYPNVLGLPFQAYLSYTSRNRLTPWGFLNVTKVISSELIVFCFKKAKLLDSRMLGGSILEE
jgi:hypothetical protein